ncbi:MAG: 3'(2'),5'-bisphosphate nucleotidase CysQ [Desulfobacterales bacterium]
MIEYLPVMIKSAVSAGIAALDVYNQDFSVIEKSDHSPLTLADTRSHEIISQALEPTDIPVLSEEGKDIAYKDRKDWERLWIVDPLDGTKEFVKRNGEFTINIALVENHIAVMGVIYVPVLFLLYFGAFDRGAHRMKIETPEAVKTDTDVDRLMDTAARLEVEIDPSRTYKIVGSRSHLTPEVEAFVEEKKGIYGDVEFVSAGSSLKFCQIAEGKADIYPRLGPTMEWDTAAGQVIAETAGARVYRHDTGEPLRYNKQDLKNPWFIVSNGRDE